ncbi:MAG: undecaprenyl-diphosphate phosphatase [Bdellovibrionales bacterium]|nr:undecaprenyl-diphosphate phosphatase [Bdellovibrionales bacterium]
MGILEAIFLGVLQGVTEFLPVSSSGHLAIAQHFLGEDSTNLLFSVVVHVATLCATLIVLRKSVVNMFSSLLTYKKSNQTIENQKNIKMFLWIMITTFITGCLGLLLKDFFEKQFASLDVVGICLIITGIILWLPKLLQPEPKIEPHALGWKKSVLLGLAQTFAILPGISRSGTTITTGLFLQLDRKNAGEYAFLISIPIILAALLLEVIEVRSIENLPWVQLSFGFVSAFVAGYFSLNLLLRWVRQGHLHYFSFYCWLVALFVLAS